MILRSAQSLEPGTEIVFGGGTVLPVDSADWVENGGRPYISAKVSSFGQTKELKLHPQDMVELSL